MEAVIVVALILIAAGAVIAVDTWRKHQRKETARQPWALEEHPIADGRFAVYAVKEGETWQLVGSVPLVAEDFSYQLELLRNEGEERCVALNARARRKR